MKKTIFTTLLITGILFCASGSYLYAFSKVQDPLARIEQKLSLIHTLRADFIQEKELSLFDKKIMIEGVLCFDRPDFFAWHVTKPMVYSMVINGGIIRQWDEETRKVQKFNVESNPALQMMVVRMREWFTGNFTGFLADYEYSVEKENPLTFVFIPKKNGGMADVVEKVKIIFRDDENYIRQIEISEKGGDKNVLIFTDIILNEPLNPGLLNVKDNF